MPVKIRLQRIGKRDQAFYRLVVADQKSKADGKTIAILGSVDGEIKPAKVKFDREKLDWWLSHGAQMSKSVRKLLSL